MNFSNLGKLKKDPLIYLIKGTRLHRINPKNPTLGWTNLGKKNIPDFDPFKATTVTFGADVAYLIYDTEMYKFDRISEDFTNMSTIQGTVVPA